MKLNSNNSWLPRALKSRTGTDPSTSTGTRTGTTTMIANRRDATPAALLIRPSTLCVICIGFQPLLSQARSR